MSRYKYGTTHLFKTRLRTTQLSVDTVNDIDTIYMWREYGRKWCKISSAQTYVILTGMVNDSRFNKLIG